MGLKDRMGSYAKKRAGAEFVGAGWKAIEKNSEGLSLSELRPRNFKDYWIGPKTEAQGRDMYIAWILPQFENQEAAQEFSQKLRMMSFVILFLAFAVGISAIFISGFIFKLSALIAFVMFAGTGTAHFHRAQQIKEKRIFGLKEIFV